MSFSKKNQQAIKGLVTSYHGFHEACSSDHPSRDMDIALWGDILLRRQAELGVEMVDPKGTQILIDAARQRIDDRRAATKIDRPTAEYLTARGSDFA